MVMDSLIKTKEMMEVFASYHFTSLDLKYNGFGNYIGKFYKEVYAGNLSKFIEHIEKAITMELESQLNMKLKVKVLFFR